jgi:hypothetical protein
MNSFIFHYLGFGARSVFICLSFGIIAYNLTGWLHWLFYVLFAVMLAFMLAKYRLYLNEPWRRVHSYGMHIFARLAAKEVEKAQKENRKVDDIDVLCKELAAKLLGNTESETIGKNILADDGYKTYYRDLVNTYPYIFIGSLADDKKDEAVKTMLKDIDASELGPDIIIAITIKKKYGKPEAARYLLALAAGVTKQRGLFI